MRRKDREEREKEDCEEMRKPGTQELKSGVGVDAEKSTATR
jgi:hypothetical protein